MTIIAFGRDKKVTILARQNSVDADGRIHFTCINGNWDGSFKDGQVDVIRTNSKSPLELLWSGEMDVKSYTQAIYNLDQMIAEGRKQP